MIHIDSDQGRIGEFWWINSDPSSIHTVNLPIAANAQMELVLWGTCGIGRDNVHVVMAPAHD
jgi:hypothetical protein